MTKISRLLILSCALLQGCNPVDDYMLGKDNTPQPKQLKPLQNKVKVAQNWSVPVGKSHKTNGYLKLKPVIRGDVIYTANASGLVQAINKSNGKVLWSTEYKEGIVSGPSVAEGLIAVGTNASTLVLLNQADGKELWQNKLTSEILSPATIAQHKVIAKTIDGRVYAFDATKGTTLWTADHGSSRLVLKASSSPIVSNNLVIVGFPDGKLDAYELSSGNIVWQRNVVYASGTSDVERLIDIDSDPIVKNNIIYLASYQGFVGALSVNDGQFLWKKPASVYKNMMLRANTLYLTDSKDVVWSIDGLNGHVNWKLTALKSRGLTEPVLVGNDLIVGDKMGYLHVIATQTGELTARSQLAAGVSISPSVSERKLYVLTDNGMLNQLSVS